MRYLVILVSGLLLVFGASAQKAGALADSLRKVNANENLSTFRKYSFSLAVSPYVNVTHGGGNYLFGATEVTFSDRFRWLQFGKNAGMEADMGFAFEPYQGTKLNLGLDYLLLSRSHRTNLYAGLRYSLGLPQGTTMDANSTVYVGFHNYVSPFLGFVWWPWKANDWRTAGGRINVNYTDPRIQQLFYIKLQIGYSVLLNNRVNVDSTGKFADAHLYQVIRNNTASTLVFRFCIGINIPTHDSRQRGNYRRKTLELIQREDTLK